jgi:two-component system chemotaxis response regulator CheB
VGTPDKPIRVVSIDDTATWRHIVSHLVGEDAGLEMVGTAVDGVEGVDLIERERPDVVTLDVEMPRMSGHEVLQELRRRGLRPRVIMLSSLTDRGAEATLQALALGAVDFVCKPAANSAVESRKILRDELIPKIRAIAAPPRPIVWKHNDVSAASGRFDAAMTTASTVPPTAAPATPPAAPTSGTTTRPAATPPARTPVAARVPAAPAAPAGGYDAVVIGVSTGGPAALSRLIPCLPGDFPRPVLIVQHMPPKFTRTLANDLNRRSELEVVEGEAGMDIIPGRVIIAPGGHHMTVPPSPGPLTVAIDDDPPIEACRPAVEKLFLSAADRWGARTVVVMLTGMGHDGQAGCTRFHELGAPIICQSPDSCVVFGMPRLPVERGQTTAVLDLDDIAPDLVRRVGGSAARRLAA